MNDRTEIDIILPCYNPPPGWEQKVIGKFKEIQSLFSPIDFHLLIVSDGSRRGYEPETVAALDQGIPGIQIIDYRPNRGKGYALRKAVQQTRSEYIIYTDYDFPYTDDSFKEVINSLLKGADIVVATRDRNYQKNLPPFRRFLSESSHLCNAIFLRLKIRDTQGGLKGFNQTGKTVFYQQKLTVSCSIPNLYIMGNRKK
mgnify:FL=1